MQPLAWPLRAQRPSEFRGQDSNLRPPGYEPGELPLLHPGIKVSLLSAGGFLRPAVSAKSPCRGKLTEFVSYHVFCDE